MRSMPKDTGRKCGDWPKLASGPTAERVPAAVVSAAAFVSEFSNLRTQSSAPHLTLTIDIQSIMGVVMHSLRPRAATCCAAHISSQPITSSSPLPLLIAIDAYLQHPLRSPSSTTPLYLSFPPVSRLHEPVRSRHGKFQSPPLR
jgi:hypothetical protein